MKAQNIEKLASISQIMMMGRRKKAAEIMIYCKDTISNQCFLYQTSLVVVASQTATNFLRLSLKKNTLTKLRKKFCYWRLSFSFIYAFRTRFNLANCLWKSVHSAWDWVNRETRRKRTAWMNEWINCDGKEINASKEGRRKKIDDLKFK
jgi:hypothetical protein